MKGGFSILFDGNACVIIDKKSRQTIANVLVTQNNLFPFDISNAGSNVLVVKRKNEPNLCHLRYDKKSRQTIAIVLVSQNNMFPVDISNNGSNVLVVKGTNEPNLCHVRYGHLHINGSKLLRQ